MDKDQAKLQAHAIQSALEQDSCDDCVSRANLISKLEILDRRYGSDFYWETRKIVDKLPSVKPQEPKTGHWIERRSRATGHIESVCSVCGAEEGSLYNDYCGNCGARMVEPQEISYTVEQELNEYTGNIEIIEKKY